MLDRKGRFGVIPKLNKLIDAGYFDDDAPLLLSAGDRGYHETCLWQSPMQICFEFIAHPVLGLMLRRQGRH
jgi:hypothetical protein